MYPTINTNAISGPPFPPARYPSQSQPSHSASFPVQQAPQQQAFPTYQGNGPSQAPSSPGAAGAFPLLRVHIAEPYSTQPPVLVGRGEADIERAQFSIDFDKERRLCSQAQQSERSSTSGQVPDPCWSAVQSYVAKGMDAEAVSLAFIALKGQLQETAVKKFCQAYKDLRSMGFPPDVVTGALILHESDVQAATDACLSVQV